MKIRRFLLFPASALSLAAQTEISGTLKMAQDFDVGGIPRAMLVDANGMIVAKDQDTRAEKLEETLAKLPQK